MLNFGTSGNTVCKITYTESTQELKEDEQDIELDMLEIIAGKVTAWISDPNNMAALDLALAIVTPSMSASTYALQPETFLFTSASYGDKKGFLSIYINCKDSGNGAGNAKPVFQPKGVETLPVPQGYSSSIIISNRLFIDKYMVPQLKASGASDVSNNKATEGISLSVKFDQTVLKECGSASGLFFSFSIDKIDFNFKDNPVTFVIKDSAFSASWDYSKTISWSESNFGIERGSNHWGKADLTIKMSKGPVAINTDDHKLTISGKVSSSDFTIDTKAQDVSFWERLGGGSSSLPIELEKDKLSLDFKELSFECHDIDFFATTNVLAPGQTMIDVDIAHGLKTPYDVVILGHVHPSQALIQADAHPALVALAADEALQPLSNPAVPVKVARYSRLMATAQQESAPAPAPVSTVAAAGEAKEEPQSADLKAKLALYAKFMDQIATAQPVAGAFYQAAMTGDRDTIKQALAKFGFDLDALLEVCELPGTAPPAMLARLDALSQSNGSAPRMLAQEGNASNDYYDFRVFSGIYSTTVGSTAGYLKVDPATLRISVGTKTENTDPQKSVTWTQVDSSITNGVVTWKSNGVDVKVTFAVDYDVKDGAPLPVTFSGTWGSDAYVGKQIRVTPETPDWVSQHPALVASFVATILGTVIGFGLPLAQWGLAALKHRREDRLRGRAVEGSNCSRWLASKTRVAPGPLDMGYIGNRTHTSVTVEYARLDNDEKGREDLEKEDGKLSEVELTKVVERTSEKIVESAHALVDSMIRKSLEPLSSFMSPEDRDAAAKRLFDDHVKPLLATCTDPDKLKKYVELEFKLMYKNSKMQKLADDVKAHQTQMDKLDKIIQDNEKKIAKLEADKKTAETKAKSASAKDKATYEDEAKKLEKDIKDLSSDAAKADRQTAEDEQKKAEEQRKDIELEKVKLEKERDTAKKDAFREAGHLPHV